MKELQDEGKVRHLEENVAAASIELSDEEFARLDDQGRPEAALE